MHHFMRPPMLWAATAALAVTISLCPMAAITQAGEKPAKGPAARRSAPENVEESGNGNAFQALSDIAVRMFSDLAVRLMSGNSAELLSGNEPALLSGNETQLLSGNEPQLLSDNETHLLSDNETELLSGNDVTLLSNNHLSVSIVHSGNGNQSGNHEEQVARHEAERRVAAFRALDENQDRQLSFDEFRDRHATRRYRKLRRQFRRLDRNTDGWLTAGEFGQLGPIRQVRAREN